MSGAPSRPTWRAARPAKATSPPRARSWPSCRWRSTTRSRPPPCRASSGRSPPSARRTLTARLPSAGLARHMAAAAGVRRRRGAPPHARPRAPRLEPHLAAPGARGPRGAGPGAGGARRRAGANARDAVYLDAGANRRPACQRSGALPAGAPAGAPDRERPPADPAGAGLPVWLIQNGRPQSAGVLPPSGETAMSADMPRYQRITITAEPSPTGSLQPTGQPLPAGKIG